MSMNGLGVLDTPIAVSEHGMNVQLRFSITSCPLRLRDVSRSHIQTLFTLLNPA